MPKNKKEVKMAEKKKKAVKKKKVKKVVKKKVLKKKVKKAKSKRKPNPAFMKPMRISDALSKIVGSKPLPRTEVTKRLWQYIKKNRLQDTVNKRNINADENLMPIFGGRRTLSMFEMTKLVSRHLS
ncbi:MAG: SWIB/MDM2 domain-containing protein [Nitrospirae bacterium]|nr:SWIB/MDM2 domain-containing protein [Nitrospirota bacterium]